MPFKSAPRKRSFFCAEIFVPEGRNRNSPAKPDGIKKQTPERLFFLCLRVDRVYGRSGDQAGSEASAGVTIIRSL